MTNNRIQIAAAAMLLGNLMAGAATAQDWLPFRMPSWRPAAESGSCPNGMCPLRRPVPAVGNPVSRRFEAVPSGSSTSASRTMRPALNLESPYYPEPRSAKPTSQAIARPVTRNLESPYYP